MLRRRNVIRGSLMVLLIAGLWLGGSRVMAQGGGRQPGAPLASAPAATIDLFERTINAAGQGTPTETGPSVQLPNTVFSGYVVLMDCGDPASTPDKANSNNWSDVLVFPDNGGSQATTVQLLSRGAAFPSYATVASTSNFFQLEIQAGSGVDDGDVTVYTGTFNSYRVHSAARNGTACPIAAPLPPAQVPEGDTLLLVGAGLAGLAGYASLRWRATRAARTTARKD
jgi:hypothetical protein